MARLERAASVDAVTGLLNRSFLDTRLHQEVGRSHREHTELAVLMADIDDFKTINDTYGHQVGDAVLKHVGEIIQSSVRVFDVCARYGGDEFAILMPNSDQARALACAERIRQRTAEYVKDTALPRFTISVGVAVGDARDGAADLVLRADRALYEAKGSGKNSVRGQTSVAPPPTAEPSAPPVPIGEVAGLTPIAPAHVQLPYVLVADTHAERRKMYGEVAGKFQLGLLIARDGAEAQRLVDQFGPPVVLAVDLSQAEISGPSGIGRAAMRNRLMSIVAFSPARELREFSRASAPDEAQFAVLHPNSKPSVVRAVVERILQRRLDASDASAGRAGSGDTTRPRGSDLSRQRRRRYRWIGGLPERRQGWPASRPCDMGVRRCHDSFAVFSPPRRRTGHDRRRAGDAWRCRRAVGAGPRADRSRDNTHGIVAAPVKQGARRGRRHLCLRRYAGSAQREHVDGI